MLPRVFQRNGIGEEPDQSDASAEGIALSTRASDTVFLISAEAVAGLTGTGN
jgi:hypothetical protein